MRIAKSMLLIALLLPVSGCGPAKLHTGSESSALLGSMQWFGYFGSATATSDYAGEVYDHSNFLWESADNLTQLQQDAPLGLYVILDVRDIFFNTSTKTLWTNYPTYQDRWNTLVSQLPVAPSTIIAFYAYDEPCKNGINPSDLATVANTIKMTPGGAFANTHLMDIEAAVGLSSCTLPADFDWFGFDCYGPWANCDFAGTSAFTFYSMLTNKVNQMQGVKKLVTVPPAVTQTFSCLNSPPNTTTSDVITWLNNDVALVQNDGMTVAMIPYQWQDHTESCNDGGTGSVMQYGDRDSNNSAVQQAFKLTSYNITGKCPNPITGPFSVGGNYYYSNGQFPNGPNPAYCSYWDSTQMTDCLGSVNPGSYPGLPPHMTNEGLCTCSGYPSPSPGSYHVSGDSASLCYVSTSAWCAYSSMTEFEQCTDLCNANSLGTAKPWGLPYNGYCSPCIRTYPPGVFKTCSGGYYYSNGSSAYCACPNTPGSYTQRGTVPAGQSYAGICGSNC